MTVDRPNQFKIRLSDEETRWLEALADAAGVTKTDFLRLLLRREHDRQAAAVKPKSK
jgi:predicted DNA-binding protein